MAKVFVGEDGKQYKNAKAAKSAGRPRNERVTANKETILNFVRKGRSIKSACDEIGITPQAVSIYKRNDPTFRDALDKAKLLSVPNANEDNRQNIPPFPEFCETYLDTRLFDHQLQWYDILEGRIPNCILCTRGGVTTPLPCSEHPQQIYKSGDPGMVIVNTPPEHSKSTTITVNYVTYRVCADPNIRVIIVSQTQEMAKRFLRAVKDRLAGANHAYKKLQVEFAPEGGFDANSSSWTADSIYVNAEARDSGEATPTVQALGMNGQIYGNRADLIILDDTVTGKNAHEFEKQIDWIQREVINRLSYPGGTLLLVGTRLAPVELYSEIQKPEWYGQDEESPWTYLTQPAVLEFADDIDDWKVLAPWTNRPPVSLGARRLVEPNEDGLYPWHSGKALARRRATSSALNWKMVYQQEQVVEEAVFPADKVMASVDGMRAAGLMQRGLRGHRDYGMDGLHVIGGFDPAITGYAAAVVLGVDRRTGVRWVLDVWTAANQKPHGMTAKLKELTTKYNVREWVVEKNMHQLIHDHDLRNFLGNRGCVMREHYTGNNKNDLDFGVASMAMLFDGALVDQGLIRIPQRSQNEGVKAFLEQLITWFPQSKARQDTVMALWFAETRARELANGEGNQFHMNNPYLSERDRERQMTIDLDYLSATGNQGMNTNWWGR